MCIVCKVVAKFWWLVCAHFGLSRVKDIVLVVRILFENQLEEFLTKSLITLLKTDLNHCVDCVLHIEWIFKSLERLYFPGNPYFAFLQTLLSVDWVVCVCWLFNHISHIFSVDPE